ncbi:MAG: VOC family protein [Pseudomonadales bacterium]
MPNVVAHFAIEADDVERARGFYEALFGWQFEAWGPPGFYLIQGAGLHGALQQRQGALAAGTNRFELTFAVDDLDASAARVTGAGGTLAGKSMTIPTVGTLQPFVDTEGNQALLMQYEPAHAAQLGLPGAVAN